MNPELSESQQAIAVSDADTSVSGAVEALLLVAVEPISVTELAQSVGVPESVVAEALAELAAFYDETGRGFELRELGGGWRYYTREEHAELITRHVLEGQQARLSQAALETLAVIAYSQPISRGRVSAVRGVNVDGVIRTLHRPRADRGGRATTTSRGRWSSPPPATSWSGWGCGRWTSCRSWRRTCPRSRSWRPSWASSRSGARRCALSLSKGGQR